MNDPQCPHCQQPSSEHSSPDLICPAQPRSALGTFEDGSPSRSQSLDPIEQIAAACGGKITERVNDVGDGSGFAILSIPLRKDHWIYQKDDIEGVSFKSNIPPMPFRMGSKTKCAIFITNKINENNDDQMAILIDKRQFEKAIRAAGKYAVRCATMNGTEIDFDPDALLQNLVVGFLGYWTENGLTGDLEDSKWCDPQKPFDFTVNPYPPSETATGQA